MKKTISFLSLFLISIITFAQQTYMFESENLTLKTEANGTLDLLWNTFNGKYRYFVKTEDNTLIELKNTKGDNKKYKEEYKQVLSDLTLMDASKTKLTTYSLKNFINQYNAAKDENYIVNNDAAKLKLRLGVFGGLTNNPFVKNPNFISNKDNETVPFFGAELEVAANKPSRHSGFLNMRYSTSSDDFDYAAFQLALGYRFKIINTSKFSIYAQTKFATLTSSKTNSTIQDPNDASNVIIIENSGTSFDVPFIFGIGTDVKLGNGYLTFVYDSLFALLIDNEDQFPLDFALGYKFNL
ncbi:hypothetical protein [Lacinutrix sp. 5H-3-7-4]|uniref:hypothetical protein n=1 Tax=Lacinutrix sp. (strain 5H-3-7-4) TaxID=983544 RepID=UPI00020A38DD|nr:hypothetical protein [Lacinutrix sp. 5H-3-7-4]AEH01170.1 hypothetical protein Lacal_1322 [Lacinutrix sp. 5H-3-7-4]